MTDIIKAAPRGRRWPIMCDVTASGRDRNLSYMDMRCPMTDMWSAYSLLLLKSTELCTNERIERVILIAEPVRAPAWVQHRTWREEPHASALWAARRRRI
jgi:hypothetical protein